MYHTPKIIAIESLCKLSHSVSKFVVGCEGNVSARIEPNHSHYEFFIKSSGKFLSNLTINDLTLCDKNGVKVNEKYLSPSIEVGIHSFLYDMFPNINFITHTHPTNTLKILCAGNQDIIDMFTHKRLFPDQVVFNGMESCQVNYGCPGDQLLELVKYSVAEYYIKFNEPPKLILLKNHGIISIGTTYEECIISTEICEKSAEIFIGSKTLGEIGFLSPYDVIKINNDEKEKYRKNLFI